MMSRGRSERAAVAANKMFAFALVKSCGTSGGLFQNPERRFDPFARAVCLQLRGGDWQLPFSLHRIVLRSSVGLSFLERTLRRRSRSGP